MFRTYFSVYTYVCTLPLENPIIINQYGLAKAFIVVCVLMASTKIKWGLPPLFVVMRDILYFELI